MSPGTPQTILGVFVLIAGLLALGSLVYHSGSQLAEPDVGTQVAPPLTDPTTSIDGLAPVIQRVLLDSGMATMATPEDLESLPPSVSRVLIERNATLTITQEEVAG